MKTARSEERQTEIQEDVLGAAKIGVEASGWPGGPADDSSGGLGGTLDPFEAAKTGARDKGKAAMLETADQVEIENTAETGSQNRGPANSSASTREIESAASQEYGQSTDLGSVKQPPASAPQLTGIPEGSRAKWKKKRGMTAIGLPRSPFERAQLPEGTPKMSRTARIEAVIRNIQEKRLNPSTMPRQWRNRIVAYFVERQPEVPNSAIANLLGLTSAGIYAIRKKIIRDATWEINDVDVRVMVTELLQKKRHAQRMALEQQDAALYWKIEKEYCEILMDLGFVSKAPIKFDGYDSSTDFKAQMERFIKAFGAVPTPAELLAILSKNRAISCKGIENRKSQGA